MLIIQSTTLEQAMKAHRWSTGRADGQRHAPAALPPGKTRYPLWRRLGGPQGWCGRVRKVSPQPGFDSRTVQSVASRYTYWSIPTHTLTGEHRGNQRKPCPSATFSITNLTRSDLKSNPGLVRDGWLEHSKYELRIFLNDPKAPVKWNKRGWNADLFACVVVHHNPRQKSGWRS
jgi:hypothetical protein